MCVLLVTLAAGGCGGGETRAERDSDGRTDMADGGQRSDGADAGDDAAEEDVRPTPSQIAAGRGLDQLAAAFAPVSERINFLVTAETLRDDAVESDAGATIEGERAGVVRIEVRRMEDVLEAARPRVAAVPVRTAPQQQVQQLLLEAIDARTRAMVELTSALDAESADLADSIVEARFATWRASWNASLRATREATTTTQDARADLGLAPAAEDAVR